MGGPFDRPGTHADGHPIGARGIMFGHAARGRPAGRLLESGRLTNWTIGCTLRAAFARQNAFGQAGDLDPLLHPSLYRRELGVTVGVGGFRIAALRRQVSFVGPKTCFEQRA